MDIFSHGLWAVAGGKFLEKKIKRPLNTWLVAWWGIFPDLFAFTVPFIWVAVEFIAGDIPLNKIPRPQEGEPPVFLNSTKVFQLATSLYNVSHSLFIFGGSFFVAWWLLKRVPWEMFGWLLHVLIDIPTHPYNFFPTPLLWPVSVWKFSHGFSWGTTWFMALNITCLILVYGYLFKKKRFFKKKVL